MTRALGSRLFKVAGSRIEQPPAKVKTMVVDGSSRTLEQGSANSIKAPILPTFCNAAPWAWHANNALLSPVLSVSSGFVRIAGEQGDLVALRVPKIADIEMRAIRCAKAGPALVKTACGKCGGVKVSNLALIARLKCDHGTVPGRGRMSIEGWFNVEIGQSDRLARL